MDKSGQRVPTRSNTGESGERAGVVREHPLDRMGNPAPDPGGEPHGVRRVLMAPLTSAAVRRANRQDLARLRAILEGDAPTRKPQP